MIPRVLMLRSLILLALVDLFGSCVLAASLVDYTRDVRPILRARCVACHGALKQEAGLRVDTGTLVRQGSDSGQIIDPGHADRSLLVQRISAQQLAERMPPEGEPLDATQIQILKSWIDQGARSPDDERPDQDPRQHWSYQPPVRPVVPQVNLAETQQNPIDAFLANLQMQRGLQAQSIADKHVRLRRIYLDLLFGFDWVATLSPSVA